MQLRLRWFAVLVAGALAFGSRLSVFSAELPQAVSAPAPTAGQAARGAPLAATVVIPGPLRSFLRMAGISQQVSPDQVMPMLARNVFLWGRDDGRDTEFLVLLIRYVQLARELQSFAGPDGVIRIADCDAASKLIEVLGYQFEQGCHPGTASLMTANAERAFLTVDSGFPITMLEQDLQNQTPFTYAFPATAVPILLTERDWAAATIWRKRPADATLLDILLHDAVTDRLYAALSHSDPQTLAALVRSPGIRRLVPVADALDFNGS